MRVRQWFNQYGIISAMCPSACIADHSFRPGGVRRRGATPGSCKSFATSSWTRSSRFDWASPEPVVMACVVTSASSSEMIPSFFAQHTGEECQGLGTCGAHEAVVQFYVLP